MKPKLKLTHIIIALILGAATWKAILLIDYFTGKTIDWKQEAPLHDGRMLIVERRSELGPSSPFMQSSRLEFSQTLTFDHPDTKEKIKWKLPDGLYPAMIDFDQETPYLVLTAGSGIDYDKWGCPNPPYLVFRHAQGKWIRTAFEMLPPSFQHRNLLNGSRIIPRVKNGSRVSATELENYWLQYPDRQRLRVIGRDKVNPIGEGCAESVLFALGREMEMDEESRRAYLNQLETMPETARAQGRKDMERLRKELKEKQQ